MQGVSSEGSRVRAELGLKRMVEIGNVPETGIKGNLQHLCRFQRQTCSGATEAQATQISVWRESGELLEDAKEMVATEPRLSGKRAEFVVQLRTGFHEANNAGDPCFCSQRTVRF